MADLLTPPPMNPLARLLAGVLAVLALAGAFFFGLVVLGLAVGLGLLAWLALTLRLWWLRRRMQRAGNRGRSAETPGGGQGGADQGRVIDADYEVVSRRRED